MHMRRIQAGHRPMMRFGRIIDPFLGERAPVAMARPAFDAGEAHHLPSVFLPHGCMHHLRPGMPQSAGTAHTPDRWGIPTT
jgi:hypothetical protein